MTSHMCFVGVSTAASSIMRIFPTWADILGLDTELVGLDVPLDAEPSTYRAAMTAMQRDPNCVGALITTHKIGLYNAAWDLFDTLDPFAASCGEISSIAFRGQQASGAAKDPITAGLALAEVLDDDHFDGDAQVLCLGAGGAGTAIGWHLAQRPDHPGPLTFVDVSAERLDHLRAVVADNFPDADLRTRRLDEADIPSVVAGLPPQSLVINATGLGKDRPGSPLPGDTVFPKEAIVWELNYRGSLEFLAQARTQQERRELTIVDGWRYFIHGWTQVIGEVFDLTMTPNLVSELSEAARTATT